MMPKGVEHVTIASGFNGIGIVIHSLMPKGVEHSVEALISTQVIGDSFVDAERR